MHRKGLVVACGVALYVHLTPALAVTNQIGSVSPATAAQGASGLLVTFTLSATPPPPTTNVSPSLVSIGTSTGFAVTHTGLTVVTALFAISADAPAGGCNVQVVFPGSVYYMTNGGFTVTAAATPNPGAFLIVDTAQTNCYDDSGMIITPAAGSIYYGQDGQYYGNQSAYTNNGDGTISDLNTGLMWIQARGAQVSWAAACAGASVCRTGGYSDWRMPTIKELYSLMQSGRNGQSFTSSAGYLPYLNTNYFGFAYGPGTSATVGDRIIDCQDWSATPYVSTTMDGAATIFGFNFADGRIKGYPLLQAGSNNTLYVRYVRGNTGYGLNNLTNNNDGTVSDLATGLMWAQHDSGAGLSWTQALAWVQARNAAHDCGYSDWRLPNAKELQGIVDYTRSPGTTASAAIHPVFVCTGITNEAGQADFPWYWSGTTLWDGGVSGSGIYICFGRAMGYMGSLLGWVDAHGAGAQRSDPKDVSLAGYAYLPDGYYNSSAPQGDAVRVYNFVRLVRGGDNSGVDHIGDGIPDWWRRQYFGGSGTTTNSQSCAAADPDGDGCNNQGEYLAGTDPTNAASRLALTRIAVLTNGVQLTWIGGTTACQYLECCTNLAAGLWADIFTNNPPTSVTNVMLCAGAGGGSNGFFRVRAGR